MPLTLIEESQIVSEGSAERPGGWHFDGPLSLDADPNELASTHQKPGCGLHEVIGHREKQEDAYAIVAFPPDTLPSADKIGQALDETYEQLDEAAKASKVSQGTCAISTCYDGNNTLVTAYRGDSESYAAVFDKKTNECLHVVRLNEILHNPSTPGEEEQIKAEGGFVLYGRVNGKLAVSRSIGDYKKSYKGVVRKTQIDEHIKLDALVKAAGKTEEDVRIQVITVCDGFTEMIEGAKKVRENWLKEVLDNFQPEPGDEENAESRLAQHLVDTALYNDSHDNITAIVHTVEKGKPFMVSLMDGHGGHEVALAAAKNVLPVFTKRCNALAINQSNQAPAVSTSSPRLYKYEDRPEQQSVPPPAWIREVVKADNTEDELASEYGDELAPEDIVIDSKPSEKPLPSILKKPRDAPKHKDNAASMLRRIEHLENQLADLEQDYLAAPEPDEGVLPPPYPEEPAVGPDDEAVIPPEEPVVIPAANNPPRLNVSFWFKYMVPTNRSQKASLVVFTAGMMMLAIGLGLTFTINPIVGIALVAVGASAALAGLVGFGLFKWKEHHDPSAPEEPLDDGPPMR